MLSCHRSKKMAIDILDGRNGEQYCDTREYYSAVLKWNPGSSAYIQRDRVFFQRMYVFLAACKEGFLAEYRPMIYVDACFIKTNGLGICMLPSPVTVIMTYTLLHMRYARPRIGIHGHGSWSNCWRILVIHDSICDHSCRTNKI